MGGGSGYITTPVVTVTGGNCTTRPTATATINATTKTVTSVTLTGAVGCSAAPILIIADPTGVAACTAAPTLTLAPPTGTTPGTTATATATVNGTSLAINVTNGGSGYMAAQMSLSQEVLVRLLFLLQPLLILLREKSPVSSSVLLVRQRLLHQMQPVL